MVYKIHKTKNYTVMSNTHLRDKNLSLKAKGLLSLVLSLPDDWDYSISGLCAICKENKTAVTSALDELKEYGYLVVRKLYANQSESGRIEYEYNFYENPTEQDTEIQPVENQYLENQPQINTDKASKEEENNIIGKPIISDEPNYNNSVVGNNYTDDGFEGHSYSDFIGSNKRKKTTRKKTGTPSLYSKCEAEILPFTNNAITANMLIEYLKLRLQMKDKPIAGVNQWKGMLNKLAELMTDERSCQQIVQQSLEHGWASFYPLQTNSKPRSRDIKTVSCEGNTVKGTKRTNRLEEEEVSLVNERF